MVARDEFTALLAYRDILLTPSQYKQLMSIIKKLSIQLNILGGLLKIKSPTSTSQPMISHF